MAESPARNTGELAKGWSLGPRCPPATAGGVPRPVQIERDPDDLEIAEYLALGFLLDLVDEAIHRLGDAGTIAAEPLAVES